MWSTYNINQLGETKSHFDGEAIRVVPHRTNQAIVVAQQIVVETLRIGIGKDASNGKVQRYEHDGKRHAPHLRPGEPLQGAAHTHARTHICTRNNRRRKKQDTNIRRTLAPQVTCFTHKRLKMPQHLPSHNTSKEQRQQQQQRQTTVEGR